MAAFLGLFIALVVGATAWKFTAQRHQSDGELKSHLLGARWGFIWFAPIATLVLVNAASDPDEAEADTPKATPKSAECIVRIPGSPEALVPGYRTEEKFDDFVTLAANGANDREMTYHLLSDKGKLVPPGTKCAYDDVGFASSRVMIVEGSFQGQKFWFVNEWIRGD